MNDLLIRKVRATRLLRSFPVLVAATSLAGLRAQPVSASPPTDPANPPMKQFVIIFRQGPHPQLTAAEQKKRFEETRAWAQQQNALGHKLDPHILTPESDWSGPSGERGPAPTTSAGPITALLFLEAHDFAEAVNVARAHPALHTGASVEVRAWAPPAPPPATRP